MLLRNSVFLFVVVSFSFGSLNAQGLPRIEVYSPNDYGDFRQKWNIVQHNKGYLFFGNSNGLVRFDGTDWQSERVEAGRIVRTLAMANDVIHWGGNSNFGIIGSDSLSALKPLSFREKVDSEEITIGRIWNTIEHKDDVYHLSFDAIYKVSGDSVSVISGETYFNVLTVLGQLVINRRDHPLSIYEDGQFQDIPGSEIYNRESVYVSLPFKDGHLFGSRNLGLIYYDGSDFIPFETGADDYLNENLIYKGVWLNEDQIALATLRGGIVVLGKNGEHQYTLNDNDGLPTNIIYDLFVDSEQTLWASTDNGIVKIFANHPLKIVNELSGISGTPTFVQPYRNRIYIGTTEGLFASDDSGKFNRIGEQAYFFSRSLIDDILYATSDNGIFQVTESDWVQLHSNRTQGVAAHPDQNDAVFSVNQTNLYRVGTATAQIDTLLNLDSNIRSIYSDHESIWLALENLTVHRVELSGLNTLEVFKIDIPGDSRLHDLQQIDSKILLSTDNGLFYYNGNSHSFEPDSTYGDPELNRYQVTRFKQCPNGDIWFHNRGKIKRAVFQNFGWQVFENNYRTIGQNEAISAISCVADGSVWISSSADIYHVQDPDWQFHHRFPTNITFAATETDTLHLGGGEQLQAPELSYDNNNLRFRYAAASFVAPEETLYRVRLSGHDEEWSDWTSETQKDYTFIREGTYSFEVESRNIYQIAGSRSTYSFTILPPWYRTVWAYLGYIMLAAGFVYGGHRVRLNSILREHRIRDGIARDLHDELSSTMSSINFFADAVSSNKLDSQKTERFLSLIQKSSSEAKEKISDIVWVIHTENDSWENLTMRCKRFSADLFDSREISYNFELKGTFSGKPTITQRKNIWLIFREIVTNIARHARSTHVELFFEAKSDRLQIEIADNGIGIDPNKMKGDGNGILNIRERVKQLNGTCTLDSQPGEGTRWVIDLQFG